MLDLRIDSLHLRIDNAAGQEHRIRSISDRAVVLLGARLGERRPAGGRRGAHNLDGLRVPPVRLDLGRMSDEEAADAIAAAVLDALALKLRL